MAVSRWHVNGELFHILKLCRHFGSSVPLSTSICLARTLCGWKSGLGEQVRSFSFQCLIFHSD